MISSLTIFLISAGCIFGGAVLGLLLNGLLPEPHLRDNSKDTIKVAAGMIATMAALVLGLLVGSAKSSFDAMNTAITQSGAKVIRLDRVLANYGPGTKIAREQLRGAVTAGIEMFWPEEKNTGSGLVGFERANAMETLQAQLHQLTPATDAQRQLQSQAEQMTDDLLQSRWLVIEQAQSVLPVPLLVVLLFWLTMLHISFGLFAARNATVIIVLLISALSVSAAIFIILEMNHPLRGMIKVSSAPIRKALEHLGQ
jgi:Na+/H+ antiporter NhaC